MSLGQADLKVNGDRINAHIKALSEFGKNPEGGVSRVAYSGAGRTAVIEWMKAAKLDPVIDAAGDIIARRAGSEPSRKPLLFGSHIDSVPNGGNYDVPYPFVRTRRGLEEPVWPRFVRGYAPELFATRLNHVRVRRELPVVEQP